MEMPQEAAANPFADPNTMAVYEQMRQTVSPKEFGDEMLAGAEQAAPEEVAAFRSALEQIEMPPEALELLNNMVDEILANPEQYAEIRAKYKEMGAPDEILPEQFDPQFFAALNMAVDQMIGEPAGVQAFAKGGIAELTPVAKAIADYGRNGDTMLAHITPAEARMLRRKGGSGTINPNTGLPEFFNPFKMVKNAFKAIGNAVKDFASSTVGRVVTTVALGFFLGPAAASFLGATSAAGIAAVSGFVGSAGSTLLAGGNLSEALKAGAVGGLTAGATVGVMGGADSFASGVETTPGQAFQAQLDKVGNVFSAPTTAAPAQIATDATQAPYKPLEMTGTPSKPFDSYFGSQPPAAATDVADSALQAKRVTLTPNPQTGALEIPAGSEVRPFTTADGATSYGTFPKDAYTGSLKPPVGGLQPNIAVPDMPAGTQLSRMPQSMLGGSPASLPTLSGVAPPSVPTVGKAFSTIGEGLGIGQGNEFSLDKLMQGGKELFSPSLSNAELARTPEYASAMSSGKTATQALAEAAKLYDPGFLRSYGPATLAGLGTLGAMGGFTPAPLQESATSKMLKGGPGSAEDLLSKNPSQFYVQYLPGVQYYNGSLRKPPGMATGGIVGLAEGGLPGINPDGSWNAQDYMARRVPGQVDTQEQVDAARRAAEADLRKGPYQSVMDEGGKERMLTAYMPGFDPNDVTTQQGLGELAWRGGNDTTSQLFNASPAATAEAKAANAAAWQREWQRLNALDIANNRAGATLSGIMPASAQQALDTRKNVSMFAEGGIADAMQYAIGGGVDKQLYDAYVKAESTKNPADYAAVNKIISDNKVTASEIQTRFNLNPADMAYIDTRPTSASSNVNYYQPTQAETTAANVGIATANPQGVSYSASDTAMYNAFRAGDYNLLNGLMATYSVTPAYIKNKFGLSDADISYITGQGGKFSATGPTTVKNTGTGTSTTFSDTPGFSITPGGIRTMPKTTLGGTQMATGTGTFPAIDDLQLAAGMDANNISPQKMSVASGLGVPEVSTRYWNAKNEAILGNYSVDPATGARTPIAARAPVAQPYNDARALTSGLSPTGPLGEYSTRAVTPVMPDTATGGITTIPNVNYTLPGVQRAMPLFASDVKLGSYRDPNTATQYTPLEQRLYDAFRSNDTTQLNNLLSQNNVSAGAVQNRFGISPADTTYMALHNGVNFFTPPATNVPAANTGTTTKLMNMGGIAGLAQGGYPRRTGQIDGPGTATSDSIPAMLSDGEFVMTAKAVRGAGKGDRRAGAKRMYALMHQLEQNAARG
jgi:hypothetical protein